MQNYLMSNDTENKNAKKIQVKLSLWNLNFILVCFSSLTFYMVFHSLNSTLPVYIEQFGGTTKIAGFALSSLTIAAIIARMITGQALNKYGRMLLLMCGLVLFLIPLVIYIQLVSVVTLIALRFVQGLGWGIGHTSVSTVALDIVPPERVGEGLGFFSLFTSLSMALSPAIALWLISQYSFRELFIACSCLTFCTLIVSLFIKYPKIEKQISDSKFKLLEITALWPSVVVFFILFSYSSTVSFLALYAIDLGLTASTAGLYFIAMALTTLFSKPFSGIIVDKAGQKGFDFCVILGSIAVISAILVMVYSFKPSHFLAAGLLYGFSSGFFSSIMLVYSIRIVPSEKKGMANAAYWTAVDLGIALGSLFWGFVAAAFGFKVMFAFTLIPAILAVFTYYYHTRGYRSGFAKYN